MDLFVTSKNILEIFIQDDLMPDGIDESACLKMIEKHAEDYEKDIWGTPLCFMPLVKNIKPYSLDTYDDCNTYQDDNYYIENLHSLCESTNQKLNFSDIKETWDGDGKVVLQYSLNNKLNRLLLDTNEIRDMVPGNYVTAIEAHIQEFMDGEYITVDEQFGTKYYFLPKASAQKIQNLVNQYKQYVYELNGFEYVYD